MIDVRVPRHPGSGASRTVSSGEWSGLAIELRVLAGDLAGRPDRDELTLDEEDLLDRELDEAVSVVLPRVWTQLEAELGPRVEGLPLHARMALLRARQRRQLGVE